MSTALHQVSTVNSLTSLRESYGLSMEQLVEVNPRLKLSTLKSLERRNLLDEPMLRSMADELAKTFGRTFDELVEALGGDYGIISNHCRDHLIDRREPRINKAVCPSCFEQKNVQIINHDDNNCADCV